MSLNNKSNTLPSTILVSKEVTTDPTKIANEFNDYFSNIADKLQNKIYNTGHHFLNYLNNRNEHSLFIKPTDKYKLIDIINNVCSIKKQNPMKIWIFGMSGHVFFKTSGTFLICPAKGPGKLQEILYLSWKTPENPNESLVSTLFE